MIADKLEAQKQWNSTPCGTGDYLAGIEPASLEFFEAIRHSRYEVTDRWMKRVINFGMARNKKLLEIGHGIGSDLLTFCEGGAEVYGIDITEEHHRLAKRNFELHGKPCVLKLCDSAAIAFPDEFFDYVYSHGVLHHTPDTVRCISEAYRVLKPGGQLILSLYRTFSAFHLFEKLLCEGVVHGKLRTLGYRGLMSTIEHGADGVRIRPLVKTYRKGPLWHMLADFSRVEFKVAHFTREHIPKIGRFLPRFLERALEPYLGWYVIAFATK
jgi:ubiquinone/menaquinone biosynthesis C-methylase UbiE